MNKTQNFLLVTVPNCSKIYGIICFAGVSYSPSFSHCVTIAILKQDNIKQQELSPYAASVFTFVKRWAASTRGDGDLVRVEFASDTVFPPRNSSGFQTRSGITKENIVAKRFVFSASEIEAIRDKYTAYSTNQERPSRVEALSAFIWSCFVAATKAESASDDKLYSLLHAVNLRSRTEPPLPDYSFRNLF
ncbi:hypothetical protein Q3G72_009370 [Acer saccharum]|nr:hypothetical protein Q3G72_009370 [Acer saccharum]